MTERHVWEEDKLCYACWSPITQPRTGRRRQFCSNACRQRWYRRIRHSRVSEQQRQQREIREGSRRVARYEREYGELNWRVRLRLSRGMPVFICPGCNRPFIVDGSNGPLPRYCSPACSSRVRWRRKKLDKAIQKAGALGRLDPRVPVRRRLGGRVPLCARCGLPFISERKAGPEPKYCSARCRKQAYEDRYRRRMRRKRLHRYHPCPVCGQRVDAVNSAGLHVRKYCSRRCKDAAARRHKP